MFLFFFFFFVALLVFIIALGSLNNNNKKKIEAFSNICDSLNAATFSSASKTTSETEKPNVFDMSFLDAHNTLRSSIGQPPVKENEKLIQAAKSWNATQCANDLYDHSPLSYAENLALGLRTPGDAVQAWFNEVNNIKKYSGCGPQDSSCVSNYMRTHFFVPVGEVGHFKNVASPGYTQIGCSADKCSKPGGKYDSKVYYTCEYLGSPTEVPAAAISGYL